MLKSFAFSFNGKNSIEYGLRANSYDIITLDKKPNSVEIPQRHGAYSHKNTFYKDRTLRLSCFWLNRGNSITRDDIRRISKWLSARGEIILDIESDKYYVGEVINAAELIAMYNRAVMNVALATFELEFICEPFAYRRIAAISISAGNNNLDYQGTAAAPCVITLNSAVNPVIALFDAEGTQVQQTTINHTGNIIINTERFTVVSGNDNILHTQTGDWLMIDENTKQLQLSSGSGELSYIERFI